MPRKVSKKRLARVEKEEAEVTAALDYALMPYTVGRYDPAAVIGAVINALRQTVTFFMYQAHHSGAAPDDVLTMAARTRDVAGDAIEQAIQAYLAKPDMMASANNMVREWLNDMLRDMDESR